MENKNIYEKLQIIQEKIKAPKGQWNKFGSYNYRSCEDILQVAKPILKETQTVLVLNDELILLGDNNNCFTNNVKDKYGTHQEIQNTQRFYIKSTATLIDVISKEKISNCAYAREEESKKGMDGSQITGTASSYARKYALNGMFAIDDTKDADTDEFHKKTNNQVIKNQIKKETPNRDLFIKYCKDNSLNTKEIAKKYKLNKNTSDNTYIELLKSLKKEKEVVNE